MYWQVYLHKTVMAAEYMLVQALRRAKYLIRNGNHLFCSPTLEQFLTHEFTYPDFQNDMQLIDVFSNLDDFDIFQAIKIWSTHSDPVLNLLCKGLVDRRLFKTEMRKTSYTPVELTELREKISTSLEIPFCDTQFLVYHDTVMNKAYNPMNEAINILFKDGKTVDIAQASDQLNISALSQPVAKYFICYPKSITQLIN